MSLIRDLRFALRRLGKSPGFTTIALAVLAVGIGANVFIFTSMRAILFSPLSYENCERLVALQRTSTEGESRRGLMLRAAHYQQFVSYSPSFETIGVNARLDPAIISIEEYPESAYTSRVNADYFKVLGLKPLLGRTFLPADEQPGAPEVAVLSETYWRRRFAANPNVIGQTLTVNKGSSTVVGVAPQDALDNPVSVDIWLAYRAQEDQPANPLRGVIGLLKPGVTMSQASAELDVLARELQSSSPETNRNVAFRLTPLERMRSRLFQDYRTPLFVLQALVAMLLLIASSNLASLLLTRATRRTREIAVRAALGASRALLVREMLAESLVLGLAGGALGLLVAQWALAVFQAAAGTAGLRIPRLELAAIDNTILIFTLGLSVVTALLFGLLPAVRASSWRVGEALKEGSRSLSEGPGRYRLRSALVVGQVALCLILLSCAGLMARSFWLMTRVDVGFELENLHFSVIQLQESDYADTASRTAFFERLLTSIESLPGTEGAALLDYPPFLEGRSRAFSGGRIHADATRPGSTQVRAISADYFSSMGIRLTRGRTFSADEMKSAAPVVIVSQALARLCWPGEEAIGRTLTLGELPLQVVGVSADVRSFSPAVPAASLAYIPFSNQGNSHMYLVTRSRGNQQGFEERTLEHVRSLDRNQLVQTVNMKEMIQWTRATHRLFLILLAVFAAAALLITVLGSYGTVSFMAARRTHEIGLRMALGADHHSILRLIVRQGLIVAAFGVVIGLPAALALGTALRGFLFGIASTDPVTYASVCALLAGVVLLASYLPARRAARLNPLDALREE